MKNYLKVMLFTVILSSILSSCEKDATVSLNPPNIPNPPRASCFIKTVTNTGFTTTYEFDNNNNLSTIKGPTADRITNIGSNTITSNYITSSLSLPGWRSIIYEA